jgi:hypothetical protein
LKTIIGISTLLLLASLGCGGGSAETGAAGAGGSTGAAGAAGETGMAGSGGGLAGAGGSLVRAVRFGNFVATLQPFDICIKGPDATEYVGPIFKAAGNTTGLTYGQVSSYWPVDEIGIHSYRFVAPNAADCATPILRYESSEPDFKFNGDTYLTVAFTFATSGGTPPTSLHGTDPQRTDSPEVVLLQLINVLSFQVDFGPVTNGTFAPTFSNVGLSGKTKTLTAPSAAAFELRETGTLTALVALPLTIPAKTAASAWVFGEARSTTNPPKLVICTNVPNPGPLSDCQAY